MNKEGKRLIKHLLTYWYIIIPVIFGMIISIVFFNTLTPAGLIFSGIAWFWALWFIGYSIWKYRRYKNNIEKEPINKEIGGN